MGPELHPWNSSFVWKECEGPFRTITPEQARAFDEYGFFVLEDAIDEPTLLRLIEEIDPFDAEATGLLRGREGGRLFIADADSITFCIHLVKRSPLLRSFCSSPFFQGLAGDLVGANVRLYWDQSVYKKTEKPRAFPWHQDNGYTFLEPQQYLTCWVALTDATVENGCPWVVPGRHRQGTLRHWMTQAGWECLVDPEGALAVPVRAGSIVVFSSLTPHRTGPNCTAQVRKSYIVQFAPDGARTLQSAEGCREPLSVLQDAPDRQFAILKDGQLVA